MPRKIPSVPASIRPMSGMPSPFKSATMTAPGALSASVIAWLWVNPPLPSPSIGAGENPRNVVAVNLVDLVVQGAGAVSVLLNQGKGNFEDGVWTPLPSPGYCAAGADFNGDGKPDVAVKYRAGRIHTAGDRVGQSPVHGGPILNPKQCRLPACRRFERRSYPRPGGASTRRRGCLPQQRQWHLHAQELHAGLDGHGRCNASRFQPGREAGFRHHRKLSGARQWRWHVPNARAADYEPSTIRIYRYRRGRSEQRRLAGPGAHQWRN